MFGRVVAHDVDDARARLACVVEVCQAVAKTGSQMQQRRGRSAGHAEEAIGRSGHHRLMQTQHAPHALDLVERGDEMHLRRAGIGKTDIDAFGDQRTNKTLGTIHRDFLQNMG